MFTSELSVIIINYYKEVLFSLYEGVCKEQYECTCPVLNFYSFFSDYLQPVTLLTPGRSRQLSVGACETTPVIPLYGKRKHSSDQVLFHP